MYDTDWMLHDAIMCADRLYKWRSVEPSTRFLIVSAIGVVAFALIPFRFIFPFIGITSFTSHSFPLR
jgi:hypothetical protein